MMFTKLSGKTAVGHQSNLGPIQIYRDLKLISFYAPTMVKGAFKFYPYPSVRREIGFHSLLDSDLSLSPPNVLKLIHNAYYQSTKHRPSLSFGGVTLRGLKLCPFINGKKMQNFQFTFSNLSLP